MFFRYLCYTMCRILQCGLFFYLSVYCVTGFCGTENTGIQVTNKTLTSITVSWDTTRTNCGYTIDKYRIYFESTSPFQTYKHKDVPGAKSNSSVIYPITPAFIYKIYVKAVTPSGNEVSNPTFITYNHPHYKPTHAPTNIHAIYTDPTSITVTWDPLNKFYTYGDVKGYSVFYRGPGFKTTQNVYVKGENSTQLAVTGLQPNSTYQFVIAVVNDVGRGSFSGFIPLKTDTLPTTTTSTTSTTTTVPTTTTQTTLVPTTYPSTTITTKVHTSTPPTTAVTTTSTFQTTTVISASVIITTVPVASTSSGHEIAEPEKETNNILMIVGIAAGVLILLAILIPLIVYMCRNCCLKGAVTPNQKKSVENTTTIPTKEAYTQVDLNFNQTDINYERKLSTDTLLSIDEYDERDTNETLSAKSKHRRFSKRALSYTDDSILDDHKQDMLQVNQPMRVDSIVETDEPEVTTHRDMLESRTRFSSADITTDSETGGSRDKPRTEKSFSKRNEQPLTVTKETTVYNHYFDIQAKIFPPRRRKISPSVQPAFMYDHVTEQSTFTTSHTQSSTSFGVKTRPPQTNPRVFVLESF